METNWGRFVTRQNGIIWLLSREQIFRKKVRTALDFGVHTFRGSPNYIHFVPDFGVHTFRGRPNYVHFVPKVEMHTFRGRFMDIFFGRRSGTCMVRAKKSCKKPSF